MLEVMRIGGSGNGGGVGTGGVGGSVRVGEFEDTLIAVANFASLSTVVLIPFAGDFLFEGDLWGWRCPL